LSRNSTGSQNIICRFCARIDRFFGGREIQTGKYQEDGGKDRLLHNRFACYVRPRFRVRLFHVFSPHPLS
jgi:hypothetical protein